MQYEIRAQSIDPRGEEGTRALCDSIEGASLITSLLSIAHVHFALSGRL